MKNSPPKVSIIMPLYNVEKYLKKSIESILQQTYPNIELIICDDCSTDCSLQIALDLAKKDKRIIVLKNETNMKAGATRNKCLQYAKGKYVAFQDADDYSDLSRIEKQVEVLEKEKQYAFVGTAGYRYNETGIWGEYVSWTEKPQKKDFLWGLPYLHASTMFRIEALKKVNGYRISKDTARTEDFDLFLRLYIAGYCGMNINEKLYYYNEDINAYLRRKYRYRIDEFKMRWNAYKKLGLMPRGIFFAFKPLIVGLIPRKLQYQLRKRASRKITTQSEPQRVLHIISKPNIGGVETMLMNVYRNIDRNKYQFDFTNHSHEHCAYEDEIINMGGKIHNIEPIREIGAIKYIFEIKRLVKENHYSIVHSHISINNSLTLLGAKLGGAKIRVSHAHTTTSEKPETLKYNITIFMMKQLNKMVANRYCACGKLAAAFLYGNSMVKKNKVIIINNAIDLDKFKKYYGLKKSIRKELNIPMTKKIIGHIGRFDGEVKNQQFILNIVNQLKSQNQAEHYLFVFVGTGENEKKYQQYCTDNGLNDYVMFYGVSDNIPKVLQSFDYLLLPSLYEGLPVVIVESQAAGVPVIASDRITKECDLGLNLVKFLSINNNDIHKWIESISCNYEQMKNYDLIEKKIRMKKYDIQSTVCTFDKLYSDFR